MTSLRNLLASCALGALLIGAVSSAQPAVTLRFDIAPQPLPQALAAFANQTGLQIIYVSDIVGTQQSKGAPAGLSLALALGCLLADTGLRFELLNAHTVRIFATPQVALTSLRVVRPTRQTRPYPDTLPTTPREVIISGTRSQGVANQVPISMAVWTQEAIEQSGIKGMSEIGALTPGVEFDFAPTIATDSYTKLVIRGVTDRHGTTTGVYLDDTPLPTARGDTYGREFPATFDLDRVEVIRGPQGVLLGQGTMGGTVRFLFNQPSLSTFNGLARAELATTARGDFSYEMGAAAGGPVISNVLGFRVSAWYRAEGGYVDHIDRFTGATLDKNANQLVVKSARAAVTWEPTSSVRITPSLFYQSSTQRAQSAFFVNFSDPAAGVLRNASLVQQPGTGSFYLGSVKLTSTLGFADLNTVTTYFDAAGTAALDWSAEFPIDFRDAVMMPYAQAHSTFSQEARLASADPNAVLTWTAGVFYSKDHNRETTSMVQGSGHVDSWTTTMMDQTQLEGFGQIGIRATSHFTVSGGVRIGRARYKSFTEAETNSRAGAADSSVTPKFDVSYETGTGKLVYLTIAKGYRSGGIYPPVAPCGGEAVLFSPDTLWSYEIGAKTDLFDGRVHFEPSVFHIQWRNAQPELLAGHGCGPAVDIRSTAASNGFDLAAWALLTERFKIALAMAYEDAHYTETIKLDNEVILHSGDALGSPPQVPTPWTITASINYQHPLFRDVMAELRAEDNFHSRNPGPFITENPASPTYFPSAQPNPSTNVLNLRATLRWSNFDLALFVNNALDSRPILGQTRGCADCALAYALTLRPRTVGVTASVRF